MIVDAHLDLAWNALHTGRDLTAPLDPATDALTSLPASTVRPSSRVLSAATSSIRASSASGVTWLPKPCEAEWSVTARYSQPRASAASAICSSVWRPSDSVVWQCRSPRRSSSSTSRGSPAPPGVAASSSPRPSRSSGGIHSSPSAA